MCRKNSNTLSENSFLLLALIRADRGVVEHAVHDREDVSSLFELCTLVLVDKGRLLRPLFLIRLVHIGNGRELPFRTH